MGSANTIYVQQTGNGIAIGFAPIADITQDAMAGGKNDSKSYQSGSGDFTLVLIDQTANGTNSQNNSFADQTGIAVVDVIQNAAAGGLNNSTSYQDGIYVTATVVQDANGAGSNNNAFVSQLVNSFFFTDASIDQGAQSGGVNNATINQDGTTDAALIEQRAEGANTANTAIIDQNLNFIGGGSSSKIFQSAILAGQNEATISQDGVNNTSRIDQFATEAGINKMTFTQLGEGNRAIANQIGTNNTGTQVQTGDGNYVRLEQMGNTNTADMTQTGDGNGVDLNQVGNLNTANIVQTGNGNVGGIIMVAGNGNNTTLIQN